MAYTQRERAEDLAELEAVVAELPCKRQRDIGVEIAAALRKRSVGEVCTGFGDDVLFIEVIDHARRAAFAMYFDGKTRDNWAIVDVRCKPPRIEHGHLGTGDAEGVLARVFPVES